MIEWLFWTSVALLVYVAYIALLAKFFSLVALWLIHHLWISL